MNESLKDLIEQWEKRVVTLTALQSAAYEQKEFDRLTTKLGVTRSMLQELKRELKL